VGPWTVALGEKELNWVARRILSLTDWSSLRELSGDARRVPEAVEALAAADSEAAADKAYWRLDNRVVVQGQLFESALPLVPVLLALLAGDLAEPARASILELLFQIAAGEPDESELLHGNQDLGVRCKTEVAKGLWLFYVDLLRPIPAVRRLALELIGESENDEKRLLAILSDIIASEESSDFRALAVTLRDELKAK